MLTAQQWIDALGLEPHVEGGYFRRTFQADHRPPVRTPRGERLLLTSIHYLLTMKLRPDTPSVQAENREVGDRERNREAEADRRMRLHLP